MHAPTVFICMYMKKKYIQICYIFAKKLAYVLRKYVICFENATFSFENISDPKKVNYSLRKYDLVVQKYGLFKEIH